jgi:NADH-ubiquinone oxidoreductase chain 5
MGSKPFIVDMIPINHPQFDFGIYLVLDWMSLGFLRAVFLISSMVLFYRCGYMHGETDTKRFVPLVVLFIASIALLIVSPSLLFSLLG